MEPWPERTRHFVDGGEAWVTVCGQSLVEVLAAYTVLRVASVPVPLSTAAADELAAMTRELGMS